MTDTSRAAYTSADAPSAEIAATPAACSGSAAEGCARAAMSSPAAAVASEHSAAAAACCGMPGRRIGNQPTVASASATTSTLHTGADNGVGVMAGAGTESRCV
eukprot:125718-Chlamydomonas_euryale.AAC.1